MQPTTAQRVAFVALLVAMLLPAACGPSQPSLSDAAKVWCADRSNFVAMKKAADTLGIDTDALLLVPQYESQGQTASAKLKADYARACTAAFQSR